MDSTVRPTEVRPFWHAWYQRAIWRGKHGLRRVVLARDPICRICDRNASTIADHIKPHKGSWELFIALENLQGLCEECHSKKTAAEDGGFGNVHTSGPRAETNSPTPTGGTGKQFQSSTISSTKLDKALDCDFSELLKGIPE